MRSNVFGSSTYFRLSHLLNARSLTLFNEDGSENATVLRLSHPENRYVGKVITSVPIVTALGPSSNNEDVSQLIAL